MGAFLSEPDKLTDPMDRENDDLGFGVSSMQGWRVSQEDAHTCLLEYDKKSSVSLFAVFDGHGGAEVAQYCALYLPQFIKRREHFKNGDYVSCLEEAFVEFDKSLTQTKVIKELKIMAGDTTEFEEPEEGEVAALQEEAFMPIEEVMRRYKKQCEAAAADAAAAATAEASSNSSSSPSGPSLRLPVTGPSHSFVSPMLKAKSASKTKKATTSGEEASHEATSGAEGKDEAGSSDTDTKESKGDATATSSDTDGKESKDGGSSSEVGTGGSKDSTEAIAEDADSEDDEFKPGDDTLDAAEEDEEDSDEDEEDSEEEEDESGNEEEEDGDEEDGDDEDDEEEELSLDAKHKMLASLLNPGNNVEEPGKDSGTTAVVALVVGNKVVVANAGDSRCVISRKGEAVEMSVDHKPDDEPEKERIDAAGGSVSADGRVMGGLNLSRAIGDHTYKQNASLDMRQQMITALPDVREHNLEAGDEFMVLACDGIWNSMTSQEVVDFVRLRFAQLLLRQKGEKNGKMDKTKENETGDKEDKAKQGEEEKKDEEKPLAADTSSQDGEKNEEKKDQLLLSTIAEELFEACMAPDTSGDGTGCDNMTCIIVKFKKFCPEALTDVAPRAPQAAVSTSPKPSASSTSNTSEDSSSSSSPVSSSDNLNLATAKSNGDILRKVSDEEQNDTTPITVSSPAAGMKRKSGGEEEGRGTDLKEGKIVNGSSSAAATATKDLLPTPSKKSKSEVSPVVEVSSGGAAAAANGN